MGACCSANIDSMPPGRARARTCSRDGPALAKVCGMCRGTHRKRSGLRLMPVLGNGDLEQALDHAERFVNCVVGVEDSPESQAPRVNSPC